MRGVTVHLPTENHASAFQLTRLMRGVTPCPRGYTDKPRRFQLTRLMRGVTWQSITDILEKLSFQLTRLMRGVTANGVS